MLSLPPILHPLLIIAGPTASGKTGLALDLAERFHGEIVNCDSVQIYRHFDIGSAKTPLERRRGIAHHLIDAAEPTDPFTAGDYSRLARGALGGITERGHLPIVVGGTGFYLRALLHGLFKGPARDEQLRARLAAIERRRSGRLHRLLARWDPPSAARIHARDINKLIRSLEVTVLTREPLSSLHLRGREPLTGYNIVGVGLDPPRAGLYRRIDERTRRMFAAGLVDECRRILALGVPETAKPFESLGYAQALNVIRGVRTLDQAIELTQIETRRYAKRQWTWFRREPAIRWFEGFGDDPETASRIIEYVAEYVPSRRTS